MRMITLIFNYFPIYPGKLSHSDLDDRALDALKEFPSDGAMAVLAQFLESNLEHVSNKSAYLCGVMKTYRQKTRAAHQGRELCEVELLPFTYYSFVQAPATSTTAAAP